MVVGAGRGPLVRASLEVCIFTLCYEFLDMLYILDFLLSLYHGDFCVHMKAAEETGRRLKVYAVEKNPNAVVTLNVGLFFFPFLLW